jgi:hypothetical protein
VAIYQHHLAQVGVLEVFNLLTDRASELILRSQS